MQNNLEQQRKRAKDLRRAYERGDADARARVAAHVTPRGSRLTLGEAQLVIAREAGHASWPKLKHAIEAQRAVDLEALLDAAVDGVALAGDRVSLHLAAARGDHARVLELLDSNVDERAGRRGWTPLLYACCARHGRDDAAIVDARLQIARDLLARGADVNARGAEVGFGSEHVDGFDVESWCALAGAAGRVGSAALVRLLIDAGASADHAPALLKQAVWSKDLAVLEAALAARPPWWQVIWALVACADLDLADHARVLAPHAQSPKSLEPGVIRAIREQRSLELVAILLGDTPSPTRRAVEEAAYRAARRYRHDAAAALLRDRGASDATLTAVDRALAGEHVAEALVLRDEDHRMLSWAIAKGRFADVPHLLAIGCDPNVHDEHGLLPLHYAVRAGDTATADRVLAAGADPHATSFDGVTAYGEVIDTSPLAFEQAVDAIVTGDVAALAALLDDEPELVHARSPRTHRCTLLHYTAANGTERQHCLPTAPAIAELLLARGADPNATCKLYGGGATTLGLMLTSVHPQAARVDGDLVRVYARHGARLDDAIDTAVQHASPLAIAALVEVGVPITLFVAAALGRVDLVEQQLERTDVNTRFADGYTALHAAAGMGHRDVVAYLLARGADRSLVDTRWGATAADKASHFGYDELAALIDAT
jgi:ankyrin repeat protein